MLSFSHGFIVNTAQPSNVILVHFSCFFGLNQSFFLHFGSYHRHISLRIEAKEEADPWNANKKRPDPV
jgi:hypothetical protein